MFKNFLIIFLYFIYLDYTAPFTEYSTTKGNMWLHSKADDIFPFHSEWETHPGIVKLDDG